LTGGRVQDTGSAFCELRGLARQGLVNPSSGLFGRLKQRRLTNVAFAEPDFQMPQPLVLRVMALAIKADDHGGKLMIGEDKVAFAVMTMVLTL
jgi:hypothetical protein